MSREFSMENSWNSFYLVGVTDFFSFPDDYLFYLKLDQLNTLKVNYMRAVKCRVFQLLTAVNELMSFKRQHNNDYSFRVRSSLLITKIWLNELRWKMWMCPQTSTYRYRKLQLLLVTEHECFFLCPDMDILRPACHVLVSLWRQRHGFAICYTRYKLYLPYFCK